MLLDFKTISDSRGSLSVVEANRQVPFDIKRVYYLYNLSPSKPRGGHAHKELRQVMVALAGAFDLILDDGKTKTEVHLCRPDQGVLIDRMVWHEMCNFTNDSVCVVFASDYYDEADYFRDYSEFLSALQKPNATQS